MTLDRDSVLSRAFGRRSGGWKSRAPLLLGCGLLAGPRARRSWAQRMRAQAARDGRACAQAHPDDHGETRPIGRRWGASGSLPALTGGRGVPGSCLLHSLLVAPFAVRAHRVIPGSSERRGGIRVTRFGGPERKRVFVCRHPRSCPESHTMPGSFINGRAPGGPGRGNVRLSRENAGCEAAFPISGGSPRWWRVMDWLTS